MQEIYGLKDLPYVEKGKDALNGVVGPAVGTCTVVLVTGSALVGMPLKFP